MDLSGVFHLYLPYKRSIWNQFLRHSFLSCKSPLPQTWGRRFWYLLILKLASDSFFTDGDFLDRSFSVGCGILQKYAEETFKNSRLNNKKIHAPKHESNHVLDTVHTSRGHPSIYEELDCHLRRTLNYSLSPISAGVA